MSADHEELVSADMLAKLRALALAAIGDLVDLETEADERRLLAISRSTACSVASARAMLDSVAAGAAGTVLEVVALALLAELLRAAPSTK